MNKINNDLEDFKYLIDSRNLTNKEKKEEKDAILKAREVRFRERSENEIKIAKLMQLKYQMEDHLNNPIIHSEPYFPKFLLTYVETLYNKRKNFASDIGIEPVVLSHVLHSHREPQANFLYRLIVHSESSYKNLCEFDKGLWPKIFYQDKVLNFFSFTEEWKKSEEKFVNNSKIPLDE